MEKEIKCQNCKNIFYSDSPFHDYYCGNCRVRYYKELKELYGSNKNKLRIL